MAGLRQRGPTVGPMKWQHVADFVLNGRCEDARRVRAGLAAQSIIVTDPMHRVRQLDLELARRGPVGILPSAMLFTKAVRVGRPRDVYARQMSLGLRQYVFDRTLRASGLGVVCGLMADANDYSLDGDVRGRHTDPTPFIDPLAQTLGTSITKAAKLASKATVLATPLLDPDSARPRVGIRGRDSVFEEFTHRRAQRALALVADHRLVVDQGHQDITTLTQRLRDMAEVHATEYFPEDRQAAFNALQHHRDEVGRGRGYVRADSDTRQIRLQIADVAAGWARTVLGGRGVAVLADTFRCVLYNGVVLGREHALSIDRVRGEHAGLIHAHRAHLGAPS